MAGSYIYPPIPHAVEKKARHALIILPFFGHDAASLIFSELSRTLYNLGYVVHALTYNDASYRPGNHYWHHVYCLKNQSAELGKMPDGVTPDFSNGIDDWAGEELPLFVEQLDSWFNFDICVCNYIFLSRAFLGLTERTKKVLCTHDVFTHRNKKLADRGVTRLDFSVTPEEEAKALNRADYIIALQPDEAKFFGSLVQPEKKVDTVYYLPPKRYLNLRPADKKLVVGYIGSSHAPNVVAILELISHIDFSQSIQLKIAGSICASLKKETLPPGVEIVGRVEDLADFYRDCDLFVNPDTLVSGIKVKCIEAFSFGVPFVCTKHASTGVPVTAPYHQADSIKSVAIQIGMVIKNRSLLDGMRKESRVVFDNLLQKLTIAKYIDQIADLRPAISVVMPTFKVEKYFEQCLASVTNQTLRNIEIIPVDDGSPDRCGEIMDRFASEDFRVKPIHQPNKGYGAAVNAGLMKARGEYIAIVETDDWIEPDMLETLYDTAKTSDANIVKGSFAKHHDGKAPAAHNFRHLVQPGQSSVKPTESLELMIYESSIWSAIYKKSFLDKHNIKMLETSGAAFQDVVWKFVTYASTDEVILVDRPFYNYRVFATGSSSAANGKEKAHFVNYAKIKSELERMGLFDKFSYFYYVHQFFDFVFHSNRLKGEALLSFYASAKETIDEAISKGCNPDSLSLHPDLNDYYQKSVLPIIRVITSPSLTEILTAVAVNDSKSAESGPDTSGTVRVDEGGAPRYRGGADVSALSVKFTEFLNLDPNFLVEVEYLSGRRELIPVVKPAYDDGDLRNLMKLHDADFVRAAYWMLLRRTVDSEGLRHYTDLIRTGIAKLEVLDRLRRSSEAKTNQISFDALDRCLHSYRIWRMPLLRLVAKFLPAQKGIGEKTHVRVIENSMYLINKGLYS
ncbi:glycosyltransferase [Burkholderia cenocepacia]|uniref:glycosyltransferase n=1 Tax=Burkholderia cenocepacia TaxID=95486 RepID=UPI002AB0581A|nr:glycosyltransferase [Burkholderia cenocepacia]